MQSSRFVLAALLVATGARPSGAQPGVRWSHQDRSFMFTVENDAIGGSSDSAYTQGLRATWEFSVWNSHWNVTTRQLALLPLAERLLRRPLGHPTRPCTPRTPSVQLPCGMASFSVGQTEYTPSNLVIASLQPNARPYAGYLFGAFTRTMLYSRGAVSTELQVGITGPPSLGQDTQSFAHWTWSPDAVQPQGWHNQLKTTIHASLVNNYAVRALEQCAGRSRRCDGSYSERRWFDLTPRVETIVGSLMDRISLGGTVRLGYGFPAATGPQRIPVTKSWGASVVDAEPWIYAFGTIDQRFVGYNALLTGSWADRDGWRRTRNIEANRAVGETAYGLAAGFRKVSASFQHVWRGPEYHLRGTSASRERSHHFGSFNITFNAPRTTGR